MFRKKIFIVILLTFFVSFSSISAQNLSYFEKASLGVYCFFSDCKIENIEKEVEKKVNLQPEKKEKKEKKVEENKRIVQQPIIHKTEKIFYKTIKETPIVVKQYPKKIIEKTVKETIIEEYDDNSLIKKIKNNRKLISQISQLIGNINSDDDDLTNNSINDLSDVNTVTAPLTNGQVLTWNNITSQWEAGSVSAGNTDNQKIALNGTTNILTLSNGTGADTTADFSVYLDNTDDQNIQSLGLSGDILTVGIENGSSQTVSLAQYALDTDLHNALTLSAGRNYLTLGAGQVLTLNVVDISDDTNLVAGTGLSLTNDTVSLNSGIDNLTDVDTTTTAPTNGDLLTWDGNNWVTTTPVNYTDNIYTADGVLAGNRIISLNGNNLYFVGSGNVGIGTVSPSYKLHIVGNQYASGLGRFDGGIQVDGHNMIVGDGHVHSAFYPNDNNHYGFFEGRRSDGVRGYYLGWGNGNDVVNLKLDNANRLDISGGDVYIVENIGIGDSTPDAKLDVAGSFRLDGTFADASGDVGLAGQILSTTATGTDWINSATLSLGSIDAHSDVDTTTVAPTNNQVLSWNGVNWVPTDNDEHTGTTGSIFFANGTNGEPTENNAQLFWNNINNRLGIGTSSPTHKLQVTGQVRATNFSGANGTAGSPIYRFNSDTDTGMFRGANNQLAFTTGGSEKVRIDNNGRVGIRTSVPDSQLQVNGNVHINRDLRVDDSGVIYTNHTYADSTLGYNLNWNLLQTEKTDDPNDRNFATITSGTGWKQGFPITRWKIGDEGNNGQHYGYVGYFPGDNWHPLFRVNTGGNDKTDLALGVMTKDIINITAGDFYVGIGTDSPTQLLDIAGNLRLRNAFYDRNNQPGTAGQILSSTVNGTDWINASNLTLGSIDSHSDVDTTTITPTNNQVLSWDGANWVPTDNNEHTGTTGSIFFAGAGGEPIENNNNLFWDNTNNRLGLGTLTPDEQLHIAQNMRLDHAFEDKDGDAGTIGQVLTSTVTGTDWVDNTAHPIPFISSISITSVAVNSVGTYTIFGYNFTPTSAVSITGGNIVNSVNILSPVEMEINVTATNTVGNYDILISNGGVLNTEWTGNGSGLFKVATEDGSSQSTAGESCKAILDDGYSAGDGTYWINPDGGDTSNAFQVYCDMTTDGGGWTRIEYAADFPHQAHFSNGDTSRWLNPADEFTFVLTDQQINDIRAVSTEGKQRYVGTCDGVIHYKYQSNNYNYAFGFRYHTGFETAYEQQTYPNTNITIIQDGCSTNNNSSTDTIFEINDIRVPVVNVHSRDNSSSEEFGSPLTLNPAWLR